VAGQQRTNNGGQVEPVVLIIFIIAIAMIFILAFGEAKRRR
jgi:hypothetical protein